MSILKYFKPAKSMELVLPDPKGPLSEEVPLASIIQANKEVMKAVKSSNETKKVKGEYIKVSPECKVKIAKYALENGNCAAARKFSASLNLEKKLNESTVRSWVTTYKKELECKRKLGERVPEVKVLPLAKRGRPLLLGETLDGQVKAYIRSICDEGGPITSTIVIAAAKAIIRKEEPKLLLENDGSISLTTDWAKSFLYRMNFVKRKGCSTKKVMVHDFEGIKLQFLDDIMAFVKMEDIPDQLVLNWDHTAINIVPGSSWTMDQKGAKKIEIIGLDDKRQITAVVCGSLNGDVLPFQLIYQGKTSACLPKIRFPKDWLLSYTLNHWSNEDKTKEYVQHIAIPHVQRKRKELKLHDTYPALVIFDMFKGQTTDSIYQMLEANNINVIGIPANCTDCLQPMDLSVNKAIKDFMKGEFSDWYSSVVYQNLDIKKSSSPVDLRLSALKPLGAKWLIKAHGYLQSNNEIIANGFKAAGVTDTLKSL